MADTGAVDLAERAARMLIAVGGLVLAMTAVAFAQDVTPVPTPEAAVATTPVPTPVSEATITPTATPSPIATPSLTATPSPSPSPAPSPSPSPSPSPGPGPTVSPSPPPQDRAAPEPTPEPTPTPPDQFTGAALTICHYTGSGYVAVTITADQYSPYFDAPNDIIPAPSAGCDNVDPGSSPDQEVTVCHRNADGTYTLLRYPPNDLGGHEGDLGDLIPAPAGACPGAAVAPTPTSTPTPSPSPVPSATPTSEPPDNDVLAEATAEPTRAARAERVSIPAAIARVSAVESGATARATPTPDTLPFTGLDLGLIVGLGFALVLMGAGLRLVAAQPVGVTR